MNKTKIKTVRLMVTLLLSAALLLLLAAAVLSVGKAYHLTLDIDTERLSPTVTGADARTGLQLTAQLQALSMDEDVALPDIFNESSALGSRFGSTAAVGDTVQGIMDYLGSYDARLGSDRSLLSEIGALLSSVEAARVLLVALGAAAVLLLAFGAGMVLTGRCASAGVLLGIDALLSGGLPPMLLWATRRLGARFSGALGVAARYGVGFSATLGLTAKGTAQVAVCACALLLIAAALILCAKLPGKRRA